MDTGHLVTLVLAAGGALSAAIGVLYRTIIQQGKDQADIREEIGKLKGEREGIERLSADVLETVHEVLRQSKDRRQGERDRRRSIDRNYNHDND